MKTALVMSGGGARGAFSVGMAYELIVNQAINFDIVRGVSVGALNGGLLAQAQNHDELPYYARHMVDVWKEQILGNKSIYTKRFLGYISLLWSNSLYKLGPLEKLVTKNIDPSKIKTSKINFGIGSVSLKSSKYVISDNSDEDIIGKIIASASIPAVFPPRGSGDDLLVDGGIRKMTPIKSAIKEGADEVYVLLTSKITAREDNIPKSGLNIIASDKLKTWKTLSILLRSLEICLDELYIKDVRDTMLINEMIKEAPEYCKSKGYKLIKLNVISPSIFYGEDNSGLDFSPKLIDIAIEHGIQSAKDKTAWFVS
jgi:NTE family protein